MAVLNPFFLCASHPETLHIKTGKGTFFGRERCVFVLEKNRLWTHSQTVSFDTYINNAVLCGGTFAGENNCQNTHAKKPQRGITST
jgi:hypothetical protein